MSNGRSKPGCRTVVLAVALAGIAVGYGSGATAAEPSAGHAAVPDGSKAPVATANAAVPGDVATEKWAFLDKYCSKCHNTQDWAGGVAFDTLTPDNIPEDA